METSLSSMTQTVVIGPDRPLTIIGERINPTGRKLLSAEMAAGNFDRVLREAIAQVDAGAHILDVNAGIPLTDEPAILARVIQLVQSVTAVPLSIDSSVAAALERGLSVYQGKALVNSVTAEEERLELILPLVKRYGAAVVGLAHDESGISDDPAVRLAAARKIVQRAQDHGIPAADVLIDPLVMPIGANGLAGRQTLDILRRCRDELGVNSCCGASNISFGLPNRVALNAAFLAMAVGAGLTSAITNPLEPEIRQAILAANLVLGRDENCRAWLEASRPPAAEGRARRRRQGA